MTVSEQEEAVVAAGSVGSVGSAENNDLTAADEQLRNLAEAIGENGRASNLDNCDFSRSMLNKRNH